jgi:hypothetical protein
MDAIYDPDIYNIKGFIHRKKLHRFIIRTGVDGTQKSDLPWIIIRTSFQYQNY